MAPRRPTAEAGPPARPPPPPPEAVRPAARPPPAAAQAAAPAGAAALGNALAQPLSVVDLDQWSNEPDRSSSTGGKSGWTPVSADAVQDGSGRATTAGPRRPRAVETRSQIGRFVSGVPSHPPDSAGDVGVISPMRLFADLAVAHETGLLRFEVAGQAKEIYLVNGTPQAVNSSFPGERFGEYLVGKGVLRGPDLERALTMLPHYAGKLGDTLVGLGLMKPLDVFRWLSQQVRDRMNDVFAWREGSFAFYRGAVNEQESFPLGLDSFEMLGAGVLNLPSQLLERGFSTMLDFRPSASGRTHISPDAFRLGPTPGEVLRLLDGERTLRDWMAHFTTPGELLTFLRSLYLLVETDLAQFH
jgi:serine/threonine-protein kinase